MMDGIAVTGKLENDVVTGDTGNVIAFESKSSL